MPESVRPYFFGARLIAISKGENKGVRPIAIGTILRKVISSAIAINVKSRLPSFFGPCQCGVGMPGGAENVVHGVRMLLEDNPGSVVVSLDLSNAFNTVSRSAFVGLVEEHFPELASWIWRCYGAKQFLLLKGQEPLLSLQLVSSKEIHWVLFSSALQCIQSLRSWQGVLFHWLTWMTSTWSLTMQGD